LAGLLSPSGICVNSISPGGFDKGELSPEFVRLYSEETPLGRMGKIGEDIKGVALLLASDAGNYITGQNILVDGGFSIWK
jgi:NAD(P)-dependent dehydrogenase (short-subunit alcohol dehydrogenase family)